MKTLSTSWGSSRILESEGLISVCHQKFGFYSDWSDLSKKTIEASPKTLYICYRLFATHPFLSQILSLTKLLCIWREAHCDSALTRNKSAHENNKVRKEGNSDQNSFYIANLYIFTICWKLCPFFLQLETERYLKKKKKKQPYDLNRMILKRRQDGLWITRSFEYLKKFLKPEGFASACIPEPFEVHRSLNFIDVALP